MPGGAGFCSDRWPLNFALPLPRGQFACIRTLELGAHQISPFSVKRGDPEEVVLRAVADHGERQSLSLVDHRHGKRRLSLGAHGQGASSAMRATRSLRDHPAIPLSDGRVPVPPLSAAAAFSLSYAVGHDICRPVLLPSTNRARP